MSGARTREPSCVNVAFEGKSDPTKGLGTMDRVPSGLVTTVSSAGKGLPSTITVPSDCLCISVPCGSSPKEMC